MIDDFWLGAFDQKIFVTANPLSHTNLAFGSGCGPGVTRTVPQVLCDQQGVRRVEAELLDRNDRAEFFVGADRSGHLAVTVGGGIGNDTLTGGAAADHIDGGAGGDTLDGREGPDVVDGGPGDDTLTGDSGGAAAADVIRGGDGDDDLQALGGLQDLSGGPGLDSLFSGGADYVISLDDVANDAVGVRGGANVHSDVERVTTGDGDDSLTGGAGAEALDGGPGRDRVVGGGGEDRLAGGSGDDLLNARDGERDEADCGTGEDVVTADPLDALGGCERVVLDRDRDGYDDDRDCIDGDARIHPGAWDVPDNGIDENCDQVDAINLDRDGDGHARPLDCDDANPGAHRGLVEIRGNLVDEDCERGPEPYLRITSGVPYDFDVLRNGRTRVALLAVRDAPVGSAINVRCRGGGCTKRIKSIRSRGLKQVSLTRHFPRPLSSGAVIEVRITADDMIGKYLRFRMRRGRPPRQPKIRCIVPGATAFSTCPAGS